MERRACRRQPLEALLLCTRFNRDRHCMARMINFCREGLCFESASMFSVGTNLLIRLEDKGVDAAAPFQTEGLRTITLAEVKWRISAGTEADPRFGYGVKYLQCY
jgi:hypothetical protein